MPVITYSGGTSLEGHFSGVRKLPILAFSQQSLRLYLQWKDGGICVDMSEMDKIIAIHGVPLLCESCVLSSSFL